jgi:hypothetical protein
LSEASQRGSLLSCRTVAPHPPAVSLQCESAGVTFRGRPPLLAARWPRPTGIASYLSEHVSLAAGRSPLEEPTGSWTPPARLPAHRPTSPSVGAFSHHGLRFRDLRVPVAGTGAYGRTDCTGVFLIRSRIPVVGCRFETPCTFSLGWPRFLVLRGSPPRSAVRIAPGCDSRRRIG